MKGLKRYVKIFRGIKMPWFLLLLTLLVAALDASLNVHTVTLTAGIIDASQKAIKTEELVIYVLFLLASGILMVADTYIAGMAYEKINAGVRVKLWNKIMRLPSRYYDEDNGNELVSRVTSDASEASGYFELAISTITMIYSAIATFRRLFAFEPTLAAWMLLIIPCSIGVGGLYGFMSYHAGFRSAATYAATIGYLVERVRNFKMIRAFRTEELEKAKGKRLFQKQFGAEVLTQLTITVIQLGIQVINCLCIVIAFVSGGMMVRAGTLTTGKLIAFYSLSSMVATSMMQLYMNFGAFTQQNGGMKKVSLILDGPEEDSTKGESMPKEDQDIRFEHVSFSYGNIQVLDDVSFTIPRGKTTALIGCNGAGKSTVMKLVERMYDPSGGKLFFGEKEADAFNLKSWRNAFAFVPQDSPLLSGTVRENILYGVKGEVSEERLLKVAKLSNIYDFISALPEGFDSQVEPEGSNFSGGQRQCIAIARALMCDPRYLLLDEATSNLDVNSEHQVSSAFEKLMEGRTTLMIAHSYASTRSADHVIVMKDGKVEAAGTPDELLASNEYYQIFAATGRQPCGCDGRSCTL